MFRQRGVPAIDHREPPKGFNLAILCGVNSYILMGLIYSVRSIIDTAMNALFVLDRSGLDGYALCSLHC